jgi:hypothetical protein
MCTVGTTLAPVPLNVPEAGAGSVLASLLVPLPAAAPVLVPLLVLAPEFAPVIEVPVVVPLPEMALVAVRIQVLEAQSLWQTIGMLCQ